MQRTFRPSLLLGKPGLLRRRLGAGVQPRTRRCFSQRVSASTGKQPERQPRQENVAGDFYVDHTCIDCDTCRWMAPSVFSRAGEMSAVTKQPEGPEERRQALQALLSCPTFSIHAASRAQGELGAARDSLPLLVPGCRSVYHTGYHAENSFGATPYLILRPGGSSGGSGAENILVDVPRWSPVLAQRIKQLGGVHYIFLTHEDDVGDHAKWAEHFGAERIIHRKAASRRQGTTAAEWQLEGEGPWALGPDCEIIYTPGHTAGCVSLLYRPDHALFTGDHLAYSARLGRLTIFRAYNWHSVPQQLDSVAKLRGMDFLRVLPGHGRRTSFRDGEEREAALAGLLEAEGWRPQQRAKVAAP